MKKNTKKLLAILLAVVLLVGAVIGGTLAWFTDKTQTVQNTFTVGNIDIELDEDDNTKDDETRTEVGNDYKMIPGYDLSKDPKVTVKANSEKCYVFVKMDKKIGNVTVGDKTYTFDDFLSYSMADGWTLVPGQTNVFYREVETSTANQDFAVIKDNKVIVNESVTKEMMDALGTDNAKFPKLDITAYAVQYMNSNSDNFTPEAAWAIANT